MSAREAILGRIGSALRAKPEASAGEPAIPASVRERIAQHPVSTRPRLASDLTELLVTQMEGSQASVVRLQGVADLPAAVAAYLDEHGIAGPTTIAPALASLGWPEHYGTGAATGIEATAVTPCLCAVAETGSLVVSSGSGTPATLNFLPENHLVVLYDSQIVAYMEDVWTRLRTLEPLPRATTMVTGPSRTADIEQTLEIGAHGPRRVHVMLVAGVPSP